MDHKRVLIVDDEFAIRYLVEHQLQRNGYETYLAKDGPSGLQAAYTLKPDLIVLDVMMPGMDGFEVCRKIRNDPELGITPVIFLTACATQKDKLRAFQIGADDYLTKPFQADEFLAHITAVLRRAHQVEATKAAARGRVVTLYSPKGGVGTTTLAIQLSEAIALREDQPVMLIDLDFPLGSIAPTLHLYTEQHIGKLLSCPPECFTMATIKQFTQRHRANLLVIPAPGQLIEPSQAANATHLKALLDTIVAAGYQVILDLGSALTELTLAALRQADIALVVTSGQPVANKLHDAFISSAGGLGLDDKRLLPVINELQGTVDDIKLARVPVARIPHASERSRTRLWLKEQGMRKLVSVVL